jgi:hypothetical protein
LGAAFGVALFLLAVLAAQAVYRGAQAYIAWRRSAIPVKTVPLDDVVAQFNTDAANDPVGQLEPPLTADEVVGAIRRQLPNLNASPQVVEMLRRIAQTRTLPVDAKVHADSGYTIRGTTSVVWWINLDLVTGPNTGYGLRIRENNSPRAARVETHADE